MAIVGQSLADGQLANTKTTIYTCPVDTVAHITLIHLSNTDSEDRTVNLYVKRSGSSSRHIIKDQWMPPGSYFTYPDSITALRLSAGDLIEADADEAALVDFIIAGGLEDIS